ncbi:MAG: hypothetical protein QY326_00465 [Bdellovibrionota bacterium]|nr:MAG: hypothetical protein QY326_00465 [Bdellovibrionota bacterium]
MEQSSVQGGKLPPDYGRFSESDLARARRTAFVARFIVLRESKRSRAHRIIEMMEWDKDATAEDLAEQFRRVFKENGDNLGPVDRDIRRALAHASRSLNYFIVEYATRATTNFIEALYDYERSNTLLFGGEEQPRTGGWRLPRELEKMKHSR